MTTGAQFLVTWRDPPHPEPVRELDDLEALLDRLRGQFEAAGEQHLVILDNQASGALLIGLGNFDSMLSWSDQVGGDVVRQGFGANESSVACTPATKASSAAPRPSRWSRLVRPSGASSPPGNAP